MLRIGDIMLVAAILFIVAVLLGGCGFIDRYLTDDGPRPAGSIHHLREFEFRNDARQKPAPEKRGHILDPVCDPEIMPTPEECK